MYQVLKPIFERTGELTPSGQPFYRVRDWVIVGTASGMEDAKSKFGGAPVLQWVPRLA